MLTASSTRRDRCGSWVGWPRSLGVVGIVGCLAVAIGVWVVRPAVTDRAHEIVAIVDNGLQKTSDLTDTAATRLTTVSERLGSITGILDSVAGSPLVDTAVGTAIRNAISGFVEGPYANLKADLSGLREQVLSISDVVTQLDAAIPGIELPGVVTGTITDVDARLTSTGLDGPVGQPGGRQRRDHERADHPAVDPGRRDPGRGRRHRAGARHREDPDRRGPGSASTRPATGSTTPSPWASSSRASCSSTWRCSTCCCTSRAVAGWPRRGGLSPLP